jgi:hypothetical protein
MFICGYNGAFMSLAEVLTCSACRFPSTRTCNWGMVGVIGLSYLAELFIVPVAWQQSSRIRFRRIFRIQKLSRLLSALLAPRSCHMRCFSIRG